MKRDSTKIGVGIIGASPNRGWALAAHIPALQALPNYEIRAVSTSRRESAEKSAQTLGVALAFDNHTDLIARPEIDLVRERRNRLARSTKGPKDRDGSAGAFRTGRNVSAGSRD